MARITTEDCLDQVENHFALVILAARRARDLAAGAKPLVVCDNKAAVTSLREVAAGKVRFDGSVDAAIRAHIAEVKKLDGDRGPRSEQRAGRKP